MHLLLVINATASSVDDRRRSDVEQHLATGHDLDIVTTTHRGHATEIAAAAVANGIDCVAVFGGDGTLNEVANALVGTDCVLAALPGGSTNVFARSIGLPRRAAIAAKVTARALSERSIQRIAVGEVVADDAAPRAFLCHTGVGWDAALVAEVERRRDGTRRRATIPLFAGAGLRTFARGYDRSAAHFRVGSIRAARPTDEAIDDGMFSLVMNSDPYTFLGPRPFRVAPSADRRSGLAVVTLRRMGTATFLRTVIQALGDGVRPSRDVEIRTGVTSLEVQCLPSRPDGVPYQVDGDHLGNARSLRFRHRADVLRVVNPGVPSP
ncbi:MAG: hypothetical protein JST64_06915 [Actinobacteria bacterium]|nr:hypothetical protein [Actinomycetota bacterium]